jgi:3-dehydroquinate dehydratase-1
MSLFAVPIRPKSLPDLKRKIKKAEPHADVIEIWMDHLGKGTENAGPRNVRALTKKMLCIANKGKEEKGKWKGSEKERVELLAGFAKSGCEYIDIGIHTNTTLIKNLIKRKAGAKIICSYHNFSMTPSENELWRIIRKMQKLGVDIVKLAAKAHSTEDALTILQIIVRANKEGIKIIGLSMGDKGKIERVVAGEFGSYMVYGALNENSRTAPGQLTISGYREFDALIKKIKK